MSFVLALSMICPKSFFMKTDIAIVGGGLAGMTLASFAGALSYDVLCIDQIDPKVAIKRDERTMAISYGSRLILEEAGIWQDCAPHACPIRDIRILDGAQSRVLLSFLAEEVEGRDFGWIVETAVLRQACLNRLEALKTVTLLAPEKAVRFEEGHIHLESGKVVEARLVVGADGRGSPLRESLNIPVRGWSYNQRALVCIIGHEHPHENVAVEHFYPSGPFAVLPMTDAPDGTHRSSVVFTEHGPERESMMHFSPDAFKLALDSKMPPSYGAVELRMGPQAYPLSLVHAASYIGPRTAFIGDAAHGIHPIAGQGLNLGYRDVKALADLLKEFKGSDPGSEALLEAYQRKRRIDVSAMVAVTDGLVRLFSNDIGPLRLLRKAGLRAVGRLPVAKRFFMRRAMGE